MTSVCKAASSHAFWLPLYFDILEQSGNITGNAFFFCCCFKEFSGTLYFAKRNCYVNSFFSAKHQDSSQKSFYKCCCHRLSLVFLIISRNLKDWVSCNCVEKWKVHLNILSTFHVTVNSNQTKLVIDVFSVFPQTVMYCLMYKVYLVKWVISLVDTMQYS